MAVVAAGHEPASAAASRTRARKWLAREVDGWSRRFAEDASLPASVLRRRAAEWLTAPELAAVRGAAVERLDVEERDAWRGLWDAVADLLRRAGGRLP